MSENVREHILSKFIQCSLSENHTWTDWTEHWNFVLENWYKLNHQMNRVDSNHKINSTGTEEWTENSVQRRVYSNVCKCSSGCINCDNYIPIIQPDAKTVLNCDVSFANSELHQAYGHATLTMSAWPKYDHRSLVGWRLPISVHTVGLLAYADWFLELCCSLMIFSVQDLGTGPINEMILFCHVIRYGWLVGFCCQIFPICPCQCSVADAFHFFSVLLLSFCITLACFSNVCTAAVVARNLVDTLTCLVNCTFILGMD